MDGLLLTLKPTHVKEWKGIGRERGRELGRERGREIGRERRAERAEESTHPVLILFLPPLNKF